MLTDAQFFPTLHFFRCINFTSWTCICLSRWVNVPAAAHDMSHLRAPARPGSVVEASFKSVSTDGTRHLSAASAMHENTIPMERSNNQLSSSVVAKSGQHVSAESAAETLSVSREEILKGVIIKGIVCTPPAGGGRRRKESSASAGSNPFEKRAAPAPPSLHKAHSSAESEPKTKSKNRNH